MYNIKCVQMRVCCYLGGFGASGYRYIKILFYLLLLSLALLCVAHDVRVLCTVYTLHAYIDNHFVYYDVKLSGILWGSIEFKFISKLSRTRTSHILLGSRLDNDDGVQERKRHQAREGGEGEVLKASSAAMPCEQFRFGNIRIFFVSFSCRAGGCFDVRIGMYIYIFAHSPVSKNTFLI